MGLGGHVVTRVEPLEGVGALPRGGPLAPGPFAHEDTVGRQTPNLPAPGLQPQPPERWEVYLWWLTACGVLFWPRWTVTWAPVLASASTVLS